MAQRATQWVIDKYKQLSCDITYTTFYISNIAFDIWHNNIFDAIFNTSYSPSLQPRCEPTYDY